MAKFIKRTLLFLLVLVTLLSAGLLIWANTANSIQQTLFLVNKFVPGITIQAENVKGTLYSGAKIDELEVNLKYLDIKASAVDVRWNILQLLFTKVTVKKLHAQNLLLDFKLDAKDNDKQPPRQEPKNLFIPVLLDIRNIELGRASLLNLPGGNIGASQVSGSVAYTGYNWKLNVKQITAANQWYRASGRLSANLAARSPFKIKADLALDVNKRDQTTNYNYLLKGTLANTLPQLYIDAKLHNKRTKQQTIAMNTTITPWQENALQQIKAKLFDVNLAAVTPTEINSSISGSIDLDYQQRYQINARLKNSLTAKDKNQNAFALEELTVKTTVSTNWREFDIQTFNARLPEQGSAQVAGKILLQPFEKNWNVMLFGSYFDLKADFNNFNPRLLYSDLQIDGFDGNLVIASKKNNIALTANAAPHSQQQAYPLYINLDSLLNPQKVTLKQLQLKLANAALDGQGEVQLPNYKIAGQLNLNAPGLSAKADSNISAAAGEAKLNVELVDFDQLKQWLFTFPYLADSKLLADLDGKFNLQASATRGWRQPLLNISLAANELKLHADENATLYNTQISQLNLTANGPLNKLAAEIKADFSLNNANWNWHSAGFLNYKSNQKLFHAMLDKLEVSGQTADSQANQIFAKLVTPTAGTWSFSSFSADAGRVAVSSSSKTEPQPVNSTLEWQATDIVFDNGLKNLTSQGKFTNIAWYWVKYFFPKLDLKLNSNSNLYFNADWNFNVNKSFIAQLNIAHVKGDVLINNGTLSEMEKNAFGQSVHKIKINDRSKDDDFVDVVPIKIDAFNFNIQAIKNNLTLAMLFDSRAIGKLDAELKLALHKVNGAWQLNANAPVSGRLSGDITDIESANRLIAPVGWKVLGRAKLLLEMNGTLAKPQLSGFVTGDDLSIVSSLYRVGLHKGKIQANISNNQLTISQINFTGLGGGTITSSGSLDFKDGKPLIAIDSHIDKLSVSNFKNRQLNLSGAITSTIDTQKYALTGNLVVNSANIVLPDNFPQSLDSDVTIIAPEQNTAQEQEPAAAPLPPIQPELNVSLDFGDNFSLSGYGAKTKLIGTLLVTSDNGQIKINGTINSKDGEFRAYGQWLKIKTGSIRFKGAYDNPSFNVIAIRPHLRDVEVGVRVTGNVLTPDIQLYSQPNMAKEEQLAWLILGKSGAGNAEMAILQQSILAAIGGKDYGGGIQALGIDQISFEGESETSKGSLSISKQISDRMYVTYQHSFGDSASTLAIYYDLTSKWTARLQTGLESALDFIYTIRFD